MIEAILGKHSRPNFGQMPIVAISQRQYGERAAGCLQRKCHGSHKNEFHRNLTDHQTHKNARSAAMAECQNLMTKPTTSNRNACPAFPSPPHHSRHSIINPTPTMSRVASRP